MTSRHDFERVGAGQLIDRQGHRRLAVERARLIVAQRAELDLGHVAQAHEAALGVGLEDHVGELLDVDQPAHRAHGELEDLAGGDGGWPI